MKKLENSECLIEFGKFIREGREKRGLYQEEVAKILGVTQAYISVIERGCKTSDGATRNVDLVFALKLCQVLRLDLNDFIKQYM